MDVLEAIRNRRSVRHLKADPIDERMLNEILEAGRWAPSWANSQCWHFVVVRDEEIKSRLADTRPQGFSGPPPAPRPGGPAGPPITIQAIKQASVIIVVCAQMGRAGVRPDGTPTTDKGDSWYMYDTALATQNILLAAHALGLGTVIIGAFDAAKAAEILGLPEGYRVVTMVPLGYPAQEAKVSPRKELSDIVSYDRFSG